MLRKEGQDEFRIGLSVSKKIGNAVVRVIKCKTIYKTNFFRITRSIDIQNMDYVIIARNPAATLDFHETKKSLEHVLKIAKVIKKEKLSEYRHFAYMVK